MMNKQDEGESMKEILHAASAAVLLSAGIAFGGAKPPAGFPRSELRKVDGNVEVFVNGERQSRMWGRIALPGQNAPEKLEQYLDAGIDIYLTNVDLEWNNGWNGDDTYDFRAYEMHLDRILAVKPDIKLVLYVGYAGAAPYKWCRANEEQLVLLSNGDRLRMGSFASEKWLRDSTRAMKAFVTHFRNSRFAKNIIGINPIMYSNEWHTPSSRGHAPLDDYSLPMQAHFRNWLREKYKGEATALRASWGVEDVTFESAAIPSEARRLRIGMEALPFGDRDLWVADYENCLEEARERFIIETCKAVKEASDGALLTTLGRNPQSMLMLQSPWVDSFHGPYAYQNRKLMNVYGYAALSYPSNGKLGMYQIDTGTHVMPLTGGDSLGVGYIWPGPFRLADNEWESLEILERDVCRAIADNRYVYWNEGGPGWMFPIVNHGTVTFGRFWFDTPGIKDLIARTKELVNRQTALNAKSTARVAVIGAQFQKPVLGTGGKSVAGLFNPASVLYSLQRSGAALSNYILEDFASIKPSYDVYIFANAFYVPAELRERIRAKLKADGATAIWLYGAGYINEDGASLENIEALTGFRLGVEHRAGPVQIAQPDAGNRLFRDAGSFGSRTVAKSNSSDKPLETYVPEFESRDLPLAFYCDDPQAEVLALFESSGKTGMAVKREDGFRSVWIGAPEVPWQLYRNLLDDAGVHIYSENGDYLMANERFAALYCITGGEKQIDLPQACQVLDALSGEEIAPEARQIRFTAKAGETRSFTLNPR